MATKIEDWTAEEFREYVQKAILRLRKGELFMVCGLSESEAIFEDGTVPPPSKDKKHPFNKLLDYVAQDLVKELGLKEKKAKKSIMKQLQNFNQVWVEMIINSRTSNDGGSLDATNPSNQSSVEEEQKETMKEEALETEEPEEGEPDPPARDDEPAPPMSALSQKKLQARKELFEKERDEILSDVPDSVKDRFGQIFFTRWGVNFLPCLALSPFSVPPGPVRDMWYEMYEKVKSNDRLKNMTNLCYWYGAYNDPNNAYSFITASKLMSFEQGAKKGYDKLSKAIQKKLDEKKKLPSGHDQLVRGLTEMNEDLERDATDRMGRMPNVFLEVYEDSEGEDEEKQKAEEQKPKASKSKKKKAKQEKVVAEDEQPKPKASKSTKKAKQEKVVVDDEQPKPKASKGKKKAKAKQEEVVAEDEQPKPKVGKGKKKAKAKQEEVVAEDEQPKASKKRKKKVADKEETESIPKKKKLEAAKGGKKAKKTKKKKDDDDTPLAESSQVAEMDPAGTDAEVMQMETADETNQNEETVKPKASQPPELAQIEDIGEDDISSHDDKDDKDVEPETESDDDDADFALSTSKAKPKKKTTQAKEPKKPPKKKEVKSKVKIEKKHTKAKKAPTQVNLKKKEQQLFEDCERKFLSVINRWKSALEKNDSDALSRSYDELLESVDQFTCPFIETYNISPLMKQSKSVLDNATRKALFKALRVAYNSKVKDKPAGFIPKKAEPQTEDTGSDDAPDEDKAAPDLNEKPAAVEPSKEKESKDSSQQPKLDDEALSSPIKRVGSLEKVDAPEQEGLPQQKPTPVKVERKKKFSLGSLMNPSSNAAKTVAKSNPGKTVPSGQLSRQQKMPAWISEGTHTETPSDENRSFALEFLQQAAPFIRHSKHVNHDAIARALEAAIYEWAVDKEGNNWVDTYWEKVHDLVASISGNRGVGTIATLIAEGKFKSPDEIVRLNDDAILCSFEGRPLPGRL